MWGYEGEMLAVIEDTVGHVKDCRPERVSDDRILSDQGDGKLQGGVLAPGAGGGLGALIGSGYSHSRPFYQFADQLLKAEMAMDSAGIERARAG